MMQLTVGQCAPEPNHHSAIPNRDALSRAHHYRDAGVPHS